MVVNDLTVQAWKRWKELVKKHPAHGNALRQGIISGMFLCLARAKVVEDVRGHQLVDILSIVTNPEASLKEIVDQANAYLKAGLVITTDMFVGVSYRTSESGRYYNEGIRMGMAHMAAVLFEVTGCRYATRTEQFKMAKAHADCITIATSLFE